MKKLRISNAPAAGTDWARVNAFTDAQIERMAKAHKEHPAASEADWAGAIVGLPSLKTPVNANFDVDVADWFKAQGRESSR